MKSSLEGIEILTIKEVAEFLRISPTSVRRLQQGRHIPFIKVGGGIRFIKNDIIKYLEENRIESMY